MNRLLPLLILLFFSCGKDQSSEEEKEAAKKLPEPEEIVLISRNAPGRYAHPLAQDSLGNHDKDTPGPKMFLPHYGFSYLDHQNIIQTWIPEKKTSDTLVIPWYAEDLELSAYNPYTSIEETFLVKNGDTVIFDFENKLPVAHVPNRQVNEVQLNYNRYRTEKLFNNKYSSHHLIFANVFLNDLSMHEENTIRHYLQAREDYERERKLLDSLKKENILSDLDHQYRLDALDVLMEKHKRNRTVREWVDRNKLFQEEGELETAPAFDLTQTDSLMKFSFFRQHLNDITNYGLGMITENNGSSGGTYIDSRKRFDSILVDDRFNQTARNYLLFDAYDGIGRNFRVRDREEYFQKLQESTTNPGRLKKLVDDYNIDFKYSDHLLLTTLSNDSLSFSEALQEHKGQWLFVDFWASWCAPCRKAMPHSRELMADLQDEEIVFIYLALNDKKRKWKEAIATDSIQDGTHYFIENANTSRVLEELGVKTIPHYMIYNPEGEIVQGFADRPGKGAGKQLEAYLEESESGEPSKQL